MRDKYRMEWLGPAKQDLRGIVFDLMDTAPLVALGVQEEFDSAARAKKPDQPEKPPSLKCHVRRMALHDLYSKAWMSSLQRRSIAGIASQPTGLNAQRWLLWMHREVGWDAIPAASYADGTTSS